MARAGLVMRFCPGDDVSINAVGREEYDDGVVITYIYPHYWEFYFPASALIDLGMLHRNIILNVRIGYASY